MVLIPCVKTCSDHVQYVPDDKENWSYPAEQMLPLHVFGLWEETGAPTANPRRYGENMQTTHCGL